jgi:aconitate hydratase
VRYTIERDGFIDIFDKMEQLFLQMLADLVGMWDREGAEKKKTQYHCYFFNRNFSKACRWKSQHIGFCGITELVTALAIAVDLVLIH